MIATGVSNVWVCAGILAVKMAPWAIESTAWPCTRSLVNVNAGDVTASDADTSVASSAETNTTTTAAADGRMMLVRVPPPGRPVSFTE